MQKRWIAPIGMLLVLAAVSAAPAAGTEADFKAALAAAEAANRQAAAVRNQWTTTSGELAASKKAAAAGNYDDAVSAAKRAEALARASIVQAEEQAKNWRDAKIH